MLTDVWSFVVDREFPSRVMTKISHMAEAVAQTAGQPVSLCESCRTMDVWKEGFHTTVVVADVQQRASSCDLCQLFNDAACKLASPTQTAVRLFRKGSVFRHGSNGHPILSIVAGLGASDIPSTIQRGFPQPPASGQEMEMQIIREWLASCDENHDSKCSTERSVSTRSDSRSSGSCSGNISSSATRSEDRMPTRLLDVGNDASAPGLLRLDCRPSERVSDKYMVLSHRWGTIMGRQEWFTTRNLLGRFQKSIDFKTLPRTFQDAITVTRQLGIRYLWIDSLCIVQYDDDDWRAEARRMEQVFSGAYCTISAVAADSVFAGFLHPRQFAAHRQRRAVKVQQQAGSSPFWVCDVIDDFHGDVECSALRKRGWVFQEHALSRRTLYFTKNQVYWECGNGVLCETFTLLNNTKASFLGDPNFPKSAVDYYAGMRIRFFEYVYESYSRLEFTYAVDRAVAIAGVEERLARTYKTWALFGLVGDRYFYRSLLWQRADGVSLLSHIAMVSGRGRVPSWSWMAVTGAISYVNVPFGSADWNESIRPDNEPLPGTATPGSTTTTILAKARRLKPPRDNDNDNDISFDRPAKDCLSDETKCVVVGSETMKRGDESQKHYVILVQPVVDAINPHIAKHQRVGVAVLRRKAIDFAGPDLPIEIV